MRRSPTTEPDRGPRAEEDAADWDELLGVWTLHFDVPRSEIVYFRLALESWEDLAVARTMERDYAGSGVRDRGRRSLVVAMAVPGRIAACRRSLARLGAEVGAVPVRTTAEMRERLRANLLGSDGHSGDSSRR